MTKRRVMWKRFALDTLLVVTIPLWIIPAFVIGAALKVWGAFVDNYTEDA